MGYKIWRDSNVKELATFKNKAQFNITNCSGQKSDYLCMKILNNIGGIYLDTDF